MKLISSSGHGECSNTRRSLNPKSEMPEMESVKTCNIALTTQQDNQLHRDTEARIFSICAKAGVSCIGIQRGFGIAPDLVLFQPTVTTLAVPLAEFANPDKAIEAIKATLAPSGSPDGSK
jgi:hypothetical protein